MKTSAAVCFGVGKPWEILEIDIDPPAPGEVLVKMSYAGCCHSDEHVRQGDMTFPPEALAAVGAESQFPVVGGHEGAGIVEQVGDGVTSVVPGDSVAVSFIPACGHCHWCATGRQQLCDLGASTLGGPMISDGSYRYHYEGQNLNRMAQLGTFSELMVCNERSLVKLDKGVSLSAAALISCGVATGFGSATQRGGTQPGDVVVVVGCGGVGSGALLGAKTAGAREIVAVDPVPFKRDKALALAATVAVSSMDEAVEVVSELTRARMANVVVLTPSVLSGDLIAPALALASKSGRVVCTAMAPTFQMDVKLNLFDLALSEKSLLGTVFGSVSPSVQIPKLLELYNSGSLPVDALITQRYALDDVEQAYEDMNGGELVRGVISFA